MSKFPGTRKSRTARRGRDKQGCELSDNQDEKGAGEGLTREGVADHSFQAGMLGEIRRALDASAKWIGCVSHRAQTY